MREYEVEGDSNKVTRTWCVFHERENTVSRKKKLVIITCDVFSPLKNERLEMRKT